MCPPCPQRQMSGEVQIQPQSSLIDPIAMTMAAVGMGVSLYSARRMSERVQLKRPNAWEISPVHWFSFCCTGGSCDRGCVCERQRKSAEGECVYVCGCVCVVLEGKSKCPQRKMWVGDQHVWSCSLITLRVVCRISLKGVRIKSEICTLMQLILN